MNKHNFIHYLQEPHLINSSQIPDLQNIISAYPYFQSAQLLLVKAFQQTENINFESQLRKTAAIAADREKLHALLFDNNVSPKESAENNSVNNAAPLGVDNEKTRPQQENNSIKEKPIHDEGNAKLANTKNPQKEPTATDDEIAILEQQIYSSALSNNLYPTISEEIPDIDELKKSENKQPSPQEDETHSEGIHSFSHWLSLLNKEKTSSLQPFKDSSDTEKEYIEREKPIKKVEFYSAAKMAKLSVQDNDDLMTETLANIYVNQENYEKAIKAFKKLQLKNPEKSSYFAGRIKEIQHKLKQ